MLFSLLQGISLIFTSSKDARGWGSQSGVYTSTQGYKALSVIPHVPFNPTVWKGVWKTRSLPKIDLLFWTLSHDSILTGENVKNKGLEGPSRCNLYLSNEESTTHLFLECKFTKDVWD